MNPTVPELILDLRTTLGEGAIWNPITRTLCFVDISAGKVFDYDVGKKTLRTIAVDDTVGTVVPREGGGLMLATGRGFAAVEPGADASGFVAAPASHDPRRCRFNDGKCDPQGRFWAGTMSLTGEAGAGALYCFDAGGSPRMMLDKVSISNGLAWSLDGKTFYYIDSPTRRVDAFSFDAESGALGDRRTVIIFPAGNDLPDGCTIDAEGMLWIAHWGGGKVTRWDPVAGRQLDCIDLPVPLVTSCAFGGEGLDTLYITSARIELTPGQLERAPLSGGLFACRPGVKGVRAFCYAG